jgi:hypothetical protein
VRAAGKQRVGSILKFERTNHAAQPILKGPTLAPPPIPFSNYPEEENRRKKKQQINRDQSGKTNANHGVMLAAGVDCGRATSFPHTTVAVPQVRNESASPAFAMFWGKRQRAIYKRACSSSAGSPDELIGKQ